jgi:hypothetical protein
MHLFLTQLSVAKMTLVNKQNASEVKIASVY